MRALLQIVLLITVLTACQSKVVQKPIPNDLPTLFTGDTLVKLDDITMYFEAHGSGTPLILLHGGFGSANDWSYQIPVFSEKYYVIAPDSRGQGRTTDSDSSFGFHRMAEDVLHLMDYLNLETAYFVGWSDGGNIGLDLAINHPERVRAVVAYGANINPKGLQDSFIESLRTLTVDEAKGMLGIDSLSDPTSFSILIEKFRKMWLTEPNYTPELLATITSPVLIIDGEDETLIRPEHAAEISASIPGAELLVLPNTGHYAVVEIPEVWSKAVLEFLSRH